MKNLIGVASFVIFQLLLLSNRCSASENSSQIDANPLARLLLTRFASSSSSSSSKNLGFLRKLAARKNADNYSDSVAVMREFGTGADWSCSAEANRASDYDSCTLSEASKNAQGGCSWCPLGSEEGVCLRASQASLINGSENEHLLHLKCYNDADTEQVIDATATAFWDEAMSCLPHHKETCGGSHGEGDHACTYCAVKEPSMGLCLSVALWDNLLVAQALEDFDGDVSTGDQIRLDQVIHCSEEQGTANEGEPFDDSLWSNPCGGGLIEDAESEAECFGKEGCAIAPTIFPGFLGSTSGRHCVSTAQERASAWAVQILGDMGWVNEMGAY